MIHGKDGKRGLATLQVTALATQCCLLMAELSYNSLWETKLKNIYFSNVGFWSRNFHL